MNPAKKPEQICNPAESGKWEAAGTEARTGMHNLDGDISAGSAFTNV
jgi:hypothetical protein